VEEITRLAVVPKGSFYNYFDSKEALAVEVLERYGDGGDSRHRILTDHTPPPVERLRRYFDLAADKASSRLRKAASTKAARAHMQQLGIRRSQLPTSQLKDPLSDRVGVAMRNASVSPQNRRIAPLTPIRRHQRVNSPLLFDGESSLPLFSRTLH
jgi:AcrR family transcriptional regulator